MSEPRAMMVAKGGSRASAEVSTVTGTGESTAAGTRFEFEAELWRWQARTDSWVFLALPEQVSDEIADLPLPPAGFGSVKVEVTLGGSRWSTSIFPDAGRKTYVLPVKAAVRRAEKVDVGDVVRVGVETVA